MDREFLKDQRNKVGPRGKFQIGMIDFVEARRAERCEKRKQEEALRKNNKKQSEGQVQETLQDEEGIGDSDDDEEIKDGDINITISEQNGKETKQNRLKLDNFARECDRYGVPDRQAAALANALFVDIGFIEPVSEAVESKNVVDKNKVRRERERVRRECKKTKLLRHKGASNVSALTARGIERL